MAQQRIFVVTAVEAKLEGNLIAVRALGDTRTGGWTDPQLDSTNVKTTLAFVATPPSGPSPDALTPIEARTTMGPFDPPFPKVIIVLAETNQLEAKVES